MEKKKNEIAVKDSKNKSLKLEDLEKNINLQKIIVVEHFFRKKGIPQLARNLNINSLDLRFYINSLEAYNLYNTLKGEFLDKVPKVESIEEFKEFLIEKTQMILETSSGLDIADIVEKIVPQIINLESAIRGIRSSPNSNTEVITDAEFSIVGGEKKEIPDTGVGFYSPIELISENPRLFTEDEREEIKNNDELVGKIKKIEEVSDKVNKKDDGTTKT